MTSPDLSQHLTKQDYTRPVRLYFATNAIFYPFVASYSIFLSIQTKQPRAFPLAVSHSIMPIAFLTNVAPTNN